MPTEVRVSRLCLYHQHRRLLAHGLTFFLVGARHSPIFKRSATPVALTSLVLCRGTLLLPFAARPRARHCRHKKLSEVMHKEFKKFSRRSLLRFLGPAADWPEAVSRPRCPQVTVPPRWRHAPVSIRPRRTPIYLDRKHYIHNIEICQWFPADH